jgi:hypothetical protein
MICQIPECMEHYGCRLRKKGIQLSPRATPTATQNWRPTPSEPPSLNAQIIYDERPGGVKMPLMNPDGTLVRHKQWRENRKTIEANIRRIRASTPEGEPSHG